LSKSSAIEKALQNAGGTWLNAVELIGKCPNNEHQIEPEKRELGPIIGRAIGTDFALKQSENFRRRTLNSDAEASIGDDR
jgi:hypothetical protein